jgi:hypothetical protein
LFATTFQIDTREALARKTKHPVKAAESHPFQVRRRVRKIFDKEGIFVDGTPELAPKQPAHLPAKQPKKRAPDFKKAKGYD